MTQAKSENEAPDLLRLKAAEFLAIAVRTKNPGIRAEAREIAERCITRALQLERAAVRAENVIPIGPALAAERQRRPA